MLVLAFLGCGNPVPDDMAAIPAGCFEMGWKQGQRLEAPPHEVCLDGFLLDIHEASVDAYKACMNAGGCGVPRGARQESSCNFGNPDRWNHPINCLSWYESERYCEWAGKRLPTEAEWEYAALGPDGRVNPWGDDPMSCRFAVIDEGGKGCGEGRTWPIGAKREGISPFGIYDMIGNVTEWVNDWSTVDYYGASPAKNPPGPLVVGDRSARGGSFFTPAKVASGKLRISFDPHERPSTYGVRCAR